MSYDHYEITFNTFLGFREINLKIDSNFNC